MQKPSNKLTSNEIKVLTFMENKSKAMSVAEMLKEGIAIPRSSLYTTMDSLTEGISGTPLVKPVYFRDGRTSFRFVLTENGVNLAQHLM